MFIATTEEMRRVERIAIEEMGIPGLILMENAGLKVVELVCQLLAEPKGKRVTLLAGKGNNGGDGFVIARHLLNRGVEVKTILLAKPEEISGDAKVNLDILLNMGHKVFPAVNPNSLNVIRVALVYTDLIIDAIYGTGFHGVLSDHLGKLVDVVNDSKKPIVSVDIPSGVDGSTGQVEGTCIKAAYTVALGLPKLGNVLSPGAEYGGELRTVDISLPPNLITAEEFKCQLITRDLVQALMPQRDFAVHKGDCGRIIVVGGSEGLTMGTVSLGSSSWTSSIVG